MFRKYLSKIFNKKVAVLVFIAIEIMILLQFLLSTLDPYFPIILSIILAITAVVYYLKENIKNTKYTLVLLSLIAMIYFIFPFKVFIFDQKEIMVVKPIKYGLLSPDADRELLTETYFLGGDVVSFFDPKYAILIKNKIGPFTFTDYITKLESKYR